MVLWWLSEFKICLSVLAVHVKVNLRNSASGWFLLYERLAQ